MRKINLNGVFIKLSQLTEVGQTWAQKRTIVRDPQGDPAVKYVPGERDILEISMIADGEGNWTVTGVVGLQGDLINRETPRGQ